MEIISNGSKWAGEEPDSIETLLDVLQREPLDPRFDKKEYGQFFYRTDDGQFHAFGNFANVSHVFNIVGSLAELLPLAKAIKENRKRIDYLLLHARS